MPLTSNCGFSCPQLSRGLLIRLKRSSTGLHSTTRHVVTAHFVPHIQSIESGDKSHILLQNSLLRSYESLRCISDVRFEGFDQCLVGDLVKKIRGPFEDDPLDVLAILTQMKEVANTTAREGRLKDAQKMWRLVNLECNKYEWMERGRRLLSHAHGGEAFMNEIVNLRYTLFCNITQSFLTMMLLARTAGNDDELLKAGGGLKRAVYSAQDVIDYGDETALWSPSKKVHAKQICREAIAHSLMGDVLLIHKLDRRKHLNNALNTIEVALDKLPRNHDLLAEAERIRNLVRRRVVQEDMKIDFAFLFH